MDLENALPVQIKKAKELAREEGEPNSGLEKKTTGCTISEFVVIRYACVHVIL